MAQISQFVKQQPGTSIYNWMSQKAVTDLVQSVRDDFPNDLNGTNYLMVYGTGTPEENAAELQAAYDAAKTMPRFIGYLGPTSPTYIYAGQTFGTYIEGSPKYYKILVDGLYTPYQMPLPEITKSEAEPVRTTVIIAPGEYSFGTSAFVVDTEGINIVSLTGNSDVIISSMEKANEYYPAYGIKVITNNILIKGINCKTNTFYVEGSLNNLICEYCIGGDWSFGSWSTITGIFNYCTGGDYSFGAAMGESSGTFNNCIGGDGSFGGAGLNASGIFSNCKAGTYSFGTNTSSGTFTNCTGGDNSFGDYEASGIFKDCTGGNNSFSRNASGIFINCIGGDGSFGSYSGTASGTFNYCIGGDKSFGGSDNSDFRGTASGTFSNCKGGNYSFAAFGTASGIFNNCVGGNNSFGCGIGATASGAFNNCIGGDGAFGNSGTASGIFTNCKGGSASFGSYSGTISGTFNYCIGGGASFGTYGGNILGTFNHCTGGNNSFGTYGGTIGASAKLCYTRITSGTFPTPTTGGRLILCIDGDNNIVTI